MRSTYYVQQAKTLSAEQEWKKYLCTPENMFHDDSLKLEANSYYYFGHRRDLTGKISSTLAGHSGSDYSDGEYETLLLNYSLGKHELHISSDGVDRTIVVHVPQKW